MGDILCVEGDQLEGHGLVVLFSGAGWNTDLVSTAEAALDTAQCGAHAVLVVDRELPGSSSGLDVCRKMRAMGSRAGIVFLTGRTDLSDKLVAFAAGADDCVQKPFEPAELCARVRALFRRSTWLEHGGELHCTAGSSEAGAGLPSWGPLSVRLGEGVFLDGVKCDLTLRQERVLTRLLRNSGHVVTNEEIWCDFGATRPPDPVNIRALIYSLRKRLGRSARFIQAFRGVGYGIGVSCDDRAAD